ncbi:hypothetical protein [Chryseobacterium sp. OSA05B]|uniref:hypothetical protein n=1 Tax=Chryseobacterium sp. OSA05B TaxID=2862650 RepID=UPI001CBD2072|nr:hypothetical protein [Chryseobacterium sp. OSA05B]
MKNIIEEETDFFSGKNLTRFFVLLTIFLILFFSYIYIASHLNWGFNMSDKNMIGDAIGGISAPFIGISTCILTFIAFYVQYDFNKKQSIFIKKQHVNEFVTEFNQTFNLIKINDNLSDTLKVAKINNVINEFTENFTADDIPSIQKNGELDINIVLDMLNAKQFYDVTSIFFNYYNPARKFIIFLDIVIREFSHIDINEKEKFNIVNNFIIKFEIVTTPEIVNFLVFNLMATPKTVIKNKDFMIKCFKNHYGTNKSIFGIYQQIQDSL